MRIVRLDIERRQRNGRGRRLPDGSWDLSS
jgi:hypothetical protein